jgi:hypothetical protein
VSDKVHDGPVLDFAGSHHHIIIPSAACSFTLLSISPLKFYSLCADIFPGAGWLYPGRSILFSWPRGMFSDFLDLVWALWYHNFKD